MLKFSNNSIKNSSITFF